LRKEFELIELTVKQGGVRIVDAKLPSFKAVKKLFHDVELKME